MLLQYSTLLCLGPHSNLLTPKEIIDKLNSEIVLFFNSPEIQKKYSAQGLQIATSKTDEFSDFLHSEVSQYEKVIKAANLTID